MKNKNILSKLILVSVLFVFIFSYNVGATYATNVSQDKLIELANKARKDAGLTSLTIDPMLSSAASDKAADMLVGQYFEHYSPDGVSPWKFITNAGYDYTYAGENLAIDFKTSEAIHNAWMASPSHKANIINAHFGNVGVAVVEGLFDNHNTKLVVQMFGAKQQPFSDSVNGLVLKIKNWMLGI
ncbi:MAG: hypothetical protein COX39_00950 [Candidatus Nealsonbacteria bacterium CG23_combo_of_CG06-09_8_20_14_all_40_13]|uniref:SCP domain-containing protein n=1 Tax=Candidatus Nealsonbacteria bacterium CG23_combo_of_CG06-09_8_20_14_all_40_13 TaxID=1974724 RepID=A0A2G9YRE0_9BACT|nr:MAG: hypothetical protein COX39_00950 [Candidatus Nealsonbacteria bacterium CG23_combo_of_CG06-09_8_20_14_all_40_13]PIR70847.1 MAG: hypothetical protein COU44_02785 [Candidatus Nealsonbacteria bacterium CG10_big_fil_rev_8_21_14_0_10_40_24]PIU43412.1 MAG: hypothetical protein COS97_01145 [Candidatus Nealsonbacteria bacterium CG07_land_8_20_14_0_80_40_10]